MVRGFSLTGLFVLPSLGYTSPLSYTPEARADLQRNYTKVRAELQDLWINLVGVLAPSLKIEKARDYVNQGVCRRLRVMRRCIHNIFKIFPVDRNAVLTGDEIDELEISLHAFLIHTHGVPDNLAWVYALERAIDLKPEEVGLFKKNTKKHLPETLRDYVNSEGIANWHKNYAKSYRDSLAHRIPPYVPPAVYTPEKIFKYRELESRIVEASQIGHLKEAFDLLEEQAALGSISPYYAHALADKPPMVLHPQIVVDAKTVMEIINKVLPHLRPKSS
jgi:hypothetical protein